MVSRTIPREHRGRFLRRGSECRDQPDRGDRDIEYSAQKFSQPSRDEAEAVAGGGDVGVGVTAAASLEIIAIGKALWLRCPNTGSPAALRRGCFLI